MKSLKSAESPSGLRLQTPALGCFLHSLRLIPPWVVSKTEAHLPRPRTHSSRGRSQRRGQLPTLVTLWLWSLGCKAPLHHGSCGP